MFQWPGFFRIASRVLDLFSQRSLAGSATAQAFTNSIGMEFILIPAGSFIMGASNDFFEESENDTLPHLVCLSKPFYLGKYPVTQAQWQAVTGHNPSMFDGANNPVETVCWDDVQIFIQKLNQKEGHNRYRLPTEAEWEYAARAGNRDIISVDEANDEPWRYAWYGEPWDNGSTHPVGLKEPNPWGLYDMRGNVWEWIQDEYAKEYYHGSPSPDPQGPSSGSGRVLRGGSWDLEVNYSSPVHRSCYPQELRSGNVGFRLALSTK